MTEFEFESTPETDAMLKQICVKECFVRCKDCKYWTRKIGNYNGDPYYWACGRLIKDNYDFDMTADDFCSRGERK